LSRLCGASVVHDEDALMEWSQYLLATRDTRELRQEELSRADAYLRVLKSLDIDIKKLPIAALKLTPFASITRAAAKWNVPLQPLLISYGHNGLESLLNAKCKHMGSDNSIAVVANDIDTREDAYFLVRSQVLPSDRIIGVEMGGCPPTAIREDASMTLAAID
jgi:hypothetical protein